MLVMKPLVRLALMAASRAVVWSSIYGTRESHP